MTRTRARLAEMKKRISLLDLRKFEQKSGKFELQKRERERERKTKKLKKIIILKFFCTFS